jgi:hypothetical protein
MNNKNISSTKNIHIEYGHCIDLHKSPIYVLEQQDSLLKIDLLSENCIQDKPKIHSTIEFPIKSITFKKINHHYHIMIKSRTQDINWSNIFKFNFLQSLESNSCKVTQTANNTLEIFTASEKALHKIFCATERKMHPRKLLAKNSKIRFSKVNNHLVAHSYQDWVTHAGDFFHHEIVKNKYAPSIAWG